MLSVVVLTKNEEKNIADCLESVAWADEIIVIDDNSTDSTLDIIQKSKVKSSLQDKQNYNSKVEIFEHSLDGDFAAQRNFGLEQVRQAHCKQASGDWILFVDADERVSQELKEEIISVTSYKYPLVKGFFLKRIDNLWGRELKHGETANVRLLRLGRKDAARLVDGEPRRSIWKGKVHEEWVVVGDVGELGEPLIHYPHQTMTEFLEEINFYSTLRAKELFDKNVKTNLLEIIFYPVAKFFKDWIILLGILDGMPGFALAVLMSLHSFFVRSKLYLLWKKK